MYDRASFANVFKPVEQAESLPPSCYASPEFFDLEVKNLFMSVWNFFGHVDQVPNAGDYITVEYVGVPLIIVRGNDGTIRAFANSCRHRGTPVADGEGNCRAFTCPYHGWVYDLDGGLHSCHGMEKTVGFDMAANGLIPLRLEVFGCFMFVNFDDAAEPLIDYLGDFPEIMGSYDLENLRLVRRLVHEVPCNWKVHIENAMEEYHLPMVHKATLNPKEMEHSAAPTSENWLDIREHHDNHTRSLLIEDLAHELPHIPTLEGRAAGGTNYVCLNPSTMLGMTLDSVWYLELQPQGPNHTRVVHGACFPSETVARADFEDKVPYYYKRWDTALGEDNTIAALQQRGLGSPFARPGRFSHLEPLVPELAQWWINHIIPED
jgi:phenylpropionate dioxygenase-like ring-hydroxylating dioxygenase large terminal subunit